MRSKFYFPPFRNIKKYFLALLLACLHLTLLTNEARANCVFDEDQVKINIKDYKNRLHGFWLGQSIGNWTGLITEMDKIGSKSTLPFYTDNDWGKSDEPAFWGELVPHSQTIEFYLVSDGNHWGADDDTDMEYLYAHLHTLYKSLKLTPEQIREGWLKHTYSEEDAPFYKKFDHSTPHRENFLWVSNEKARILMEDGFVPPETSNPKYNSKSSMIDAQLTTEIFGLLSPGNPQNAIDMAYLPIRTTATGNAALVANFYVYMHSLAFELHPSDILGENLKELAIEAAQLFPSKSTPKKIFEYVLSHYDNNTDKQDWEHTRNAIYERYQVQSNDGYIYKEPFDSMINFAASLISLFYGDGDLKRTIQIAALVGWDSDNPAATWGGLLGFIYGANSIKNVFSETNLSDTFWIHRTRRNFPTSYNDEPGIDHFHAMANRETLIVNRVIEEKMSGCIDNNRENWIFSVN